ncbi:uncharacterized protein LOC142236744 [Haematobia irritans]|uniref:uncharacterized protein LOC142236744 n=1 Tax=Haematobia irritans TaxID=7368 RepID=UPI003F4F73DE
MAYCENSEASGFYQTALDSLMDNLFISSTPNLESNPEYSRKKKCHDDLTPDQDEFFSLCNSLPKSNDVNLESNPEYSRKKKCHDDLTPDQDEFFSLCNSLPKSNDVKKAIATEIEGSVSLEGTPKRALAGSRRQKLFVENEANEFKPRRRTSNLKEDLSPQTRLLKKAILRMESLQRRQDRMALNKKPVRTSLRI